MWSSAHRQGNGNAEPVNLGKWLMCGVLRERAIKGRVARVPKVEHAHFGSALTKLCVAAASAREVTVL